MKKNAALAVSAVALLAACGGGSSAVNNNPTLPPSASPTVQTLKSYSDGSGVLSAEGIDLGGANLSNMVIFATDVPVATEIVSGAISLSVVPGTSQTDGTSYYVQRTGTASNGTSLVIDSFGESLNLSGSEYASLSIVQLGNGDAAFNTAGTVVNGIPNGTFSYTGFATVADIVDGTGGDGTFTMQANFNSRTATIAATVPATNTTPQYFFSANDITINPTTGNFFSVDAAMGEANVSSQNSSINGYFAGTAATGVHGILYPNSTSNGRYFGGFYGSR